MTSRNIKSRSLSLSSNTGSRPGRRRDSIDIINAKVAVDLATHQTYEENVFLFVPNLIGYGRILLAGLALNYMKSHPKVCTALYGLSCLLDAVDGMAARALGQTSKFGAVLDMVTDRCTTACLLCFLSSAYPPYALLFQFLITLDFSSHYMHMYSSLVTGARSHKLVTSDVSRILWYYYNDPTTLFLFCAGNELFFVALYLMHWEKSSVGWPFTSLAASFLKSAVPLIPAGLVKPATLSNIALFISQLTWAQVLAIITAPVCLAKNIINVVQLWKASKILVGVDLAERAKDREVLEMREE
ncbi:CDP-diacylglycerol-inositol 3-phosphatidyltransferase [Tulasnella sp. 427]|nr:CDP-diacylglycerol-inositol 3-phosphatidyltransferase [Tulasnella sp. 427]